jgi:hypothetical protein
MTSAVRAVPKSGFLGARLGCGDIHALKRCFILAISPALYLFRNEQELECNVQRHLKLIARSPKRVRSYFQARHIRYAA